MSLKRILRHLWICLWHTKQAFPARVMTSIENAINESEKQHRGEVRFVVESSLSLLEVVKGKTARARALELFADLHLWDTEDNSGVLIYVLLADRQVEIVADRGINALVNQQGWQKICEEMEAYLRQDDYEAGVLAGISLATEHLKQHFPLTAENKNELPNRPLIM